MAKVNVYLPDDLEADVRDAGLTVSPICQQALRHALDRVAGVRAGDAARGRMTPRLAEVIAQAKADRASRGRKVAGDDLLCFVMKHGENLGARALAMLDVDLPDPALQPPRPEDKGESISSGRPADGELDGDAQDLLVAAYKVAVEMRHDHLGTEHVVIAVAEGGGLHGEMLKALGASPRAIRAQVEKLIANPWTNERTAPEPDPVVLSRIEGELERLAGEVDRLRRDPTS